MEIELLGPAGKITEQNHTLIIKTDTATAYVSVYNPGIIRVRVTRNRKPDAPSFAVIQQALAGLNYHEHADTIEINTPELKLRINKSPLRFNFYTPDGRHISGDDDRFGTVWQGESITNYRKMFTGERFIGLGEKTGNLDRRGSNYVNWNTDAVDYNAKTDPLYKSIPFFIGLHDGLAYGIFLDNTHRSWFDFGSSTDHEMYWMGADGGDMDYYFFGAQSQPGNSANIAPIIRDYTWLTGRMEMPPLWGLGYQQCRWSYMSADELLEIAKKFRKHHIPADVLYCDIDYMDGYKIFTWDKKTFPKPKKLIDDLKDMGFRLVTIVDPGIKIEEGYKQYDEGVAKNYFATYPNGDKYIGEVWPGRCHFPDFFNEEVRHWWGASFSTLTQPGVAGFWNDMNEPAAWGQNVPSIVKFGDRYLPEVRNAYGMQMARATYNGTKKLLKNKRPFVLTRAAYAGIQRYSAVWTGDNTANNEHLLLGCRLVNSLGISGVALTGVDIGGFSGNPTPELMVRWNSLGVYTPMFRNHAMIGTVMREPWQWGRQNERIIKKDIELRYQLLPYIYSAFYQAHQTGLPVNRTLAIDYPFNENVYDHVYQNQFLFGDSMLVAPAESTATNTKVYLPPGEWYRFNSDKKMNGGRGIKADAPLTDLPVFIKAGAIIPMQSVIQHTGEKGDGILQLHIWNGKQPSIFVYYEDDGVSYNYEKGEYYKRSISFDPRRKQLVLSTVEGSFASRYQQINVVWHGFGKVADQLVENSKGEMVVGY